MTRNYKKEDAKRGNARKRGYKTQWDKVRKKKREQDPYCEECKKQGLRTLTEVVHHKKKVKDRPDLLLDMNNLESLCKFHHAERHSKNMSRKKIWNKTDNSMERQKAELRIKYLPRGARVLDLFCGNGEMYNQAYKDRVSMYHGTDKEKVHDLNMCTLINNTMYIAHNDISGFNVFDLDDYGTPWKLLYLILRKLPPGEITIFITDGLVMHQKVDGTVTKFVSATEKVPKKMNIPGLNRFYVDIFGTMLKDIENRYGWKTEKAVYFHNERRSVYYWALKLKHNTLGAI